MYYIVTPSGQVEGPYAAEWIRTHAKPKTQVSHGQAWVRYAAHPDFALTAPDKAYYVVGNSGAAEGPHSAASVRALAHDQTLVSLDQQWIPYAKHPDFRVVAPTPRRAFYTLTDRSTRWLLLRSIVYLAGSIAIAALILTNTDRYIRRAGVRTIGPDPTLESNFEMVLTWLLGYVMILVPAYVFGRIFGGRARFSEIMYGFARTAAVLYLLIPLAHFMYWRWFLQQGIILQFVAVIFQFLLVPAICIFFGVIAFRTFLSCMAFRARWRSWITVLASVAFSTMLILVSSDWFTLWNAFVAWLGRLFA